MMVRRTFIRAMGLVTGLVGTAHARGDEAPPEKPAARTAGGNVASDWILPADFLAPEGGGADAQGPLQQAIDASARSGRPVLINGVYRLDRPLRARANMTIMGSGTLRAAHSGSMFESGDDIVSRVRIDGLRLEAGATEVRRAIDGHRWQYATLRDLRLMTAGGVFREGIAFEQVAYWNKVSGLEGEAVQTLFVLNDANNLILDDINWCRFSDIGMKQFIAFTGPCGSIHGRALSIEGIFRDTVLLKMHPDCTGLDLEFLRVEGREGSKRVAFLDFNGARGNWLRLSPAFFGVDSGGLSNESGNVISFIGPNDVGVFHMGTGQAVAPLGKSDPSLPGGFNYNPQAKRFRIQMEGARSVAVTPAIEPLELAGQPIKGARSLNLQRSSHPSRPTPGEAVLFFDAKNGALCVMFDDGVVRRLVAREDA